MKQTKFILAAVLALAAIAPLSAQNNMILVKGGTFQMGNNSEKDAPVHTVTVSDFYMSQTKITLDEWMSNTGVYPKGFYREEIQIPQSQWSTTAAGNITWYDAIVYCNRRSRDEGLTPCYASNGSKDNITYAERTRYSSDYYNESKNSKDPHGSNHGDMRVYRGGQRETSISVYESVPVYKREMFYPEEYITAAGPYPYSFRVVRNAK